MISRRQSLFYCLKPSSILLFHPTFSCFIMLFYAIFCSQNGAKKKARIVKRKRKNGCCYSVTVRRKGYPSATRTFDTKGEALAWATALEQEMKDLRYQNPSITKSITFSQIMAKYITTITPQKAITTQTTEKNISKRLIEILGAETPLCDITPVVVARYRDNRLKRVSATPVR
ncbi:MAG: hypothetical protein CSA32_05640, partial [Desulfobulbus propionicus]